MIPSPAFRRPTLSACAERRVLRLCLWLSLPACAFRSSSGSSGGQASGLRLPLVPSGPSGLFRLSRLASGTLNPRLPVAGSPDSHRALRPQALCLRPTSNSPSINPLTLLTVSVRLAPSSGFVCSLSDSFPTYCSFISWTDITDRSPVHASSNNVFCVDNLPLFCEVAGGVPQTRNVP
jgi:hypothetical protein